MLKKMRDRFCHWGFGKTLLIILVLFTLIPLFIIQQMMMHFYEKHIINEASNSTLAVVKANNNVLDLLLDNVETASQMILDNELYYNTFSRLNELSVGDLLRYDRIISTEIAKQFSALDEISNAYLYTSRWLFGSNSNTIPITIDGVRNAGFGTVAMQAAGLPCWITGYDYGRRIGSEYLIKKGDYEARYPLTMVREMNFQYSSPGIYHKLSGDQERPVLVVHLLEKRIRTIYQESISYDSSTYAIANSAGTIVSSDSESFPIGSRAHTAIMEHYGQSGYLTCRLDGRLSLLCFDTIPEKELFSFAFIPMDVLTKNTLLQTRHILFGCMIALILMSLLVAYLLSRAITRPILLLKQASERVSNGDFSADTPETGIRDFRQLTRSFNHMEHEINRLIHENYEIALREKETQLMALSMQINPHFLYNTLNTINMLAIQNNDEETSELIVDLSEMLQYTFKSSSDKGPLSEEIGWVSNYLYIMSRRYDHVFRTVMDIEEDLTDCKIPKFILQPLVENSILHGFSDMFENGVLSIKIARQDSFILIEVADNGKGMDAQELEQYLKSIHQDGHVGISNVHRRLTLLYGEDYKIEVSSSPGQGTCIRILIPYEV